MNTIEIAGGSVAGRAHLRAGRGSQDAMAWRAGEVAIAVVCDGCSGGARSEVGAAIGARLWIAALAERIDAGSDLDDGALWDGARDAVVARLADLAGAMDGPPEKNVTSHFLFTSVIAAWTERKVAVRAIGDGAFAIDGELHALGPFDDNAPPYVGYAIVGAPPAWSCARVVAADELDRVLLATDGATPLDLPAIARDDRWFRNPDALRRHLFVSDRDQVSLADDATIVVMRRAR